MLFLQKISFLREIKMSEKTIASVVGRDEHILIIEALDSLMDHCLHMALKAQVAGLGIGQKFWSKRADEARALQAELRDIQH